VRSSFVLSYTILFLLSACSPEQSTEPAFESDRPDYYIVGEDLARIRADFNVMQDKIRLVFIVGPSCGICLRGMDDLNEALVHSLQNDPRIHTLVIHVPALGAQEKHVAASIPLLAGPHITHYWDPVGRTGLEFQETLGISMYAWDIWMLYEPGARWQDNEAPPEPDYWEHQLSALPSGLELDAERFAAATNARLAKLTPATEESRIAAVMQSNIAIIPVEQPHGVMIQQNHLSRGGYHTLKRIESIRYEGTTEVADQSFPLLLQTSRPTRYERRLGNAGDTTLLSWDGNEVKRDGAIRWLPASFENEMLRSWEFDGWMTDWKAKGHQVRRLGMKKDGDRLPWLLEAKLANGRTWHIYVDSHTGDTFRTSLVNADGSEQIRIEYSEYKEADGFRLAHRIRYFERDQLLAPDLFSSIPVTVAPGNSD